MSTNTTNYNLVKPTDADDADISIINANMDVIDTEMKATADKTAVNTSEISALNISLNGVVQSLDGLTETSINICASTDYTVNRVRGMALTTTVPTTVPNGCLVGVYV